MIYYQSKELATRFGIPVGKWKRWVREFLPPDPLGGLQSGFARQFNLKDAFRVFLGGCLVGTLKYTIPESRTILSDLDSWLEKNGFYRLHTNNKCGHSGSAGLCVIYIYEQDVTKFGYSIGSIPVCQAKDPELNKKIIKNEQYCLTPLMGNSEPITQGNAITARMVSISALYNLFLEQANQI